MKTLTNHQIVRHNNVPVAVVVPYLDYEKLMKLWEDANDILTDAQLEAVKNDAKTIPHEIVKRITLEKISIIRAWREHLNLTQDDMAKRMEISQAAYAKMEKAEANLRHASLKKIAMALGVELEQLDV